MNAQIATPKKPFSLLAALRQTFDDMRWMVSNTPPHGAVPDFRHLEITRRVWNAPMLVHSHIHSLLMSDEHFRAGLPDASVPYLLRVVVGEDEIRASLFRTQPERLEPIFDDNFYQNGEVSFIVQPNKTIEPLVREAPGLYFDVYEPDVCYLRELSEEEQVQIRKLASPYFLPIEPLTRKHSSRKPA